MQGYQDKVMARDVASLMGWWQDAGVDQAIAEEPQPWLGRSAVAQPVKAEPIVAPLPGSLDTLANWIKNSPDFTEAGPSQRRIAPAGMPHANVMILTDMPESDDHLSGQMMSGQVGILFDRMLAAIGLDRSTVWISSLSPSRPATGRIAADDLVRLSEIAQHHIKIAAPKRLWLLGQTTSRAVLGVDELATKGKLHLINHGTCMVEVVASMHPRLLLQNPARKAGVWAEMQMLMKGIAA